MNRRRALAGVAAGVSAALLCPRGLRAADHDLVIRGGRVIEIRWCATLGETQLRRGGENGDQQRPQVRAHQRLAVIHASLHFPQAACCAHV